eukprot:m.141936 g.141936  ORF g.141936 m.141936 type:complete len:827 (-) comp30220_c3_seq3:406-2886(-)
MVQTAVVLPPTYDEVMQITTNDGAESTDENDLILKKQLKTMVVQTHFQPHGKTRYLIGKTWWTSLTAWYQNVKPPFTVPKPGPIDNSDIVDPVHNNRIMEGIMERHFRQLSLDTWTYLSTMFGLADGQTPVTAHVNTDGRFDFRPLVHIHVNFVFPTDGLRPCGPTVYALSPLDPVSTLYTLIRKTFEVPPDTPLRLSTTDEAHVECHNAWNIEFFATRYARDGDFVITAKLGGDGGEDEMDVDLEHIRDATHSASNRSSPVYGPGGVDVSDDDLDDLPSLSNSRPTSPGACGSRDVAESPPPRCIWNSPMADVDAGPRVHSSGLTNLGNTCFMNSSLQCLANINRFRSYFLKGRYKPDINYTNPIGCKGELAASYAATVHSMWSKKNYRSFAPRDLKEIVGKFGPRFQGYEQHDSQEFISFLLDAIHEDLNRVKQKPIVQNPETDGMVDVEAARLAWEGYKLRNDSIVVDLFSGMFKATVQCPRCDKVSVKFDPYMVLSLPLPEKPVVVKVVVMFWDGRMPVKYGVTVPKGRILVKNILKKLSPLTKLSVEELRCVSYDPKKMTSKILTDTDTVKPPAAFYTSYNDGLFRVYQIDPAPNKTLKAFWIHQPEFTFTSKATDDIFGFPLVLAVDESTSLMWVRNKLADMSWYCLSEKHTAREFKSVTLTTNQKDKGKDAHQQQQQQQVAMSVPLSPNNTMMYMNHHAHAQSPVPMMQQEMQYIQQGDHLVPVYQQPQQFMMNTHTGDLIPMGYESVVQVPTYVNMPDGSQAMYVTSPQDMGMQYIQQPEYMYALPPQPMAVSMAAHPNMSTSVASTKQRTPTKRHQR